MRSLKARGALFAALVVASAAALAWQEVTVNGQTWSCENQCVVYTYPNGGFMVVDSLGGRLFRVNPA